MSENKKPSTPEELIEYLEEHADSHVYDYIKCEGYSSIEKKQVEMKLDMESLNGDYGYDEGEDRYPSDFADVIGTVLAIDSYGGEGEGDDYWIVIDFKDHNCLVRVDGWYASYDGGYLDGIPYLVEPKERTVIIYEKKEK